MIRNLKAMGLALAAMLALGAVVASGASAQQLTSDGPVTLDITETGSSENTVLKAFGSVVDCPESKFYGHKYNETPHDLIPGEGESTVTITPEYEEPCHVSGGRQATIADDGCDFVFHLGAKQGAGTYAVTADLVCEGSNDVTVSIFSNTPPTAPGTKLCTVTITPQSGLAGAHATDTGNGDITVTGTFKKIHVERSGLCLFDGKGSTENNGEFPIDVTVSGTDKDGKSTSISLSD